jgi:hypothetical protein
MAAYKMAAVKVTPPNDFPFGLIRSLMVVIHLFLMLCDLQRVERDLWTTLYFQIVEEKSYMFRSFSEWPSSGWDWNIAENSYTTMLTSRMGERDLVRSGDRIPVGGDFPRPSRPSWGLPSLLYNEYRVTFPGVKRPGRGVDRPPPSSAEVNERVQLFSSPL